jgi:hypothetical protein
MYKMPMICYNTYDPFYGFKVIKKDNKTMLYVRTWNDSYLAHIEDINGRLLGTIPKDNIKEYFI